jgi:hypothetical protein
MRFINKSISTCLLLLMMFFGLCFLSQSYADPLNSQARENVQLTDKQKASHKAYDEILNLIKELNKDQQLYIN